MEVEPEHLVKALNVPLVDIIGVTQALATQFEVALDKPKLVKFKFPFALISFVAVFTLEFT